MSVVRGQNNGTKLVGTGAVGSPVFQGTSIWFSANGTVLASAGDGDNGFTGAVWVFTLNTATGIYAQQGSKLVGSGAVGGAKQGYLLTLSGNGAVIASGGRNDNADTGAVWVFTLNTATGVYAQQGSKLVGSGALGAAQQGRSVSLSANGTVLASGGYYDNSNAGAVWIFTLNTSTGVYAQQGSKLVGSGAVGAANQGESVSLSENGAVLASGGDKDNSSAGAVWIFTLNTTTGVYAQQGSKLVGSGAVGAAWQGWSVSLSANGAVLASGGRCDNANAGAVWVFTLNTATGVYAQQGSKLVGSGTVGAANQGHSVALSANGGVLASGGRADNSNVGAVWIFTLNTATGVYVQFGSKLVGSGAVGSFILQGAAVSLSANGTVLASGGPHDTSDAGALWIFNLEFSPPCPLPSDSSSTIFSTQCISPLKNSTSCTPICTNGYTANASLTISCVNGNLTTSLGKCNPNPCNILANTPSTTYTSYCIVTTPSGQSCTPVCNNGYTSNASLTINCFAGSFSSPTGTCNPNPCPRPLDTSSTIYNQASCPSPTLSGSTCTPTCAPGYTANGSLVLSCSLGNFSYPPAGVCNPNPCNRPSDTTSTIYSSSCPSSISSGYTCTPSCTNGYSPTGDLSIKCTAGSLSIPSGSCNPNPCSSPSPSFPTTVGSCSTSTPSGTSCALGCAQGYLVNGSLSITCTRGNFSSASGNCYFDLSRLQCSQPTPPFPLNSGNCPSTLANGTVCTFGCSSGYSPVGNLNATCINQTIIVAYSSASCQQNPCNVQSLPIGLLQGSCSSTQEANTSCYYTCSPGYTQIGPLNVTCTAGNFSAPLGYCSANPCYQPTITSSSAKTVGDCAALTSSGSSCTLGCINDLTPVGIVQVTCIAGSFSSSSNGYCVGVADVFTSTTSLANNPPLVASPGTQLNILLSSLGNIPSDVVVSNYSVNGVYADSNFRMPDLNIQNITASLTVYISSATLALANFPLSNFYATLLYLQPPTITSACPNQILAQVNQFVIVQGTGFADSNYIRCVLNGTIASAPTAVNPTSVSCNLFWPIAEVRNIDISIANDGATGNTISTSLPIEIIGACQSQKPGSIAGANGCVCPVGTYDTGSGCQLCGNGQYQDEQGQTACKQCGSNQDTNYKIGSASKSACVCSAANYLDYKKNACVPCVTGMYCPGNNIIKILPGYWRASNTTSIVLPCPGSSISCPGTLNSSSLCSIGYTGPECLVCETGYAKRGYFCNQCINSNLNGFALAVLILFAILLAYFLIKSASVQSEETFDSSAEKATKAREGSLQVLIKVTLNYLQVLYYIGRLSSNWSDLSRRFFEAVGIVGALSPQTYTIQCAANWRFYDTLIFIFISPAILIAILTFVYLFLHVIKHRSYKETLTNLQLAIMLLLYQIHPTILLNVISSFPCDPVPGTGTSYLKADYSVDCKSAEYQGYAAASAIYLVVYVFGMVGVTVLMLRRNHILGKLHSPAHNAYFKYRFFFMGYRPNTYFWEAVIMMRKMGVVAFSVLASPMLQLVFGNVMLVIALVLNIIWIPFASFFVNRLESLSLSALLATVTLGFLFLNADSHGGDTLWISILLIIINTAMMAILVFYSFQYLRQYVRKLEKLLPKQWRSDAEDDIVMTKNRNSIRITKNMELNPI